ncbi:hypothetical protein MMC10_007895 [Thelotrema lepadinum]|nr:hypothetical protein [Thelotrema lepadinum]
MKFTLAFVALFFSAALAAPLRSAATRDLNESVETMTDASGAIVPFNTATVPKNTSQ